MGCFTLFAFLYLYLLRMGVNEDSNIPHRTGQNMRLMGAIRTKSSYAGPLICILLAKSSHFIASADFIE